MDKNDECTPIEDSFPDEHIFSISTNPLWYVDIAKYIATEKVPHHFSYREQQKNIHHNARYSWMVGYLFHIGADK